MCVPPPVVGAVGTGTAGSGTSGSGAEGEVKAGAQKKKGGRVDEVDAMLTGTALDHRVNGVSPRSSTKDLVRQSFLFNGAPLVCGVCGAYVVMGNSIRFSNALRVMCLISVGM